MDEYEGFWTEHGEGDFLSSRGDGRGDDYIRGDNYTSAQQGDGGGDSNYLAELKLDRASFGYRFRRSGNGGGSVGYGADADSLGNGRCGSAYDFREG